MRKLLRFIKTKWADPVWSKVFAAGIIALISTVGLFIVSLIKKIPFAELWTNAISYLTNRYLSVSYLALVIIAFILLVLLIPMIRLKVIQFQLRHLKFPQNLKSTKLNLENFLQGTWELVYKHSDSTLDGIETVRFVDGNKYYSNDELAFVLTDISFDETKNDLKWTKTRYKSNKKHSRESLSILTSDDAIVGTDDIGFQLKYSKIK